MLQVGALQSRGRRDHSLCADDQGQVADVLIVAHHVVAGVVGRLRNEGFARRPTVSHEGSLSSRAPRRVPQRDSKASRMIRTHRRQPQLAREIGNYWDLTSALLCSDLFEGQPLWLQQTVGVAPTRWGAQVVPVALRQIRYAAAEQIRTRGSRCD